MTCPVRNLTAENLYTSVSIAEILLDRKITLIGTVITGKEYPMR